MLPFPVHAASADAICTRCGHRFDEHAEGRHGYHPCDFRHSPSRYFPAGKPCICYAFETIAGARERLADIVALGQCVTVHSTQYGRFCLTHDVDADLGHHLANQPDMSPSGFATND